MSLALGVENDVILALLDGVLLPVLSVEVRRVFAERLLLDPVDIVIEQADRLFALIDDLDAGRLAKRHVPEAVVGIGVFDNHRQTDDLAAPTEGAGEEVAEGRLDGGLLPAVPVHAQQHLLVIGRTVLGPGLRLGTEERNPDMRNDAGPLGIQQDLPLAGGDVAVIPIAIRIGPAVGIGFAVQADLGGRGRPHTASLVRLGQVREEISKAGSTAQNTDRRTKRKSRSHVTKIPSDMTHDSPPLSGFTHRISHVTEELIIAVWV